jgi:hypothetical protein
MPNDDVVVRTDMQVVYLVNDDGSLTGIYPAGLCHYCRELFYWDSGKNAVYHRPQNLEGRANCPNRGKWFAIGPMVELAVDPSYVGRRAAYARPERAMLQPEESAKRETEMY